MGARFAVSADEGTHTVTASSTKTMLELMGDADVTAVLCELGISFNGTASTDAPILVELIQITASGTGTTLTEQKWSRSGPTAQVSAKSQNSAEPTGSAVIASWYVHPQGGNLLVQWPLGREPVICDGSASQGLAVRYISPSLGTTSYTAYAVWEE